MGALCCCFRVEDFEDNEDSSTDRHCTSFNSCIFYKYATLFSGRQMPTIPLPNQGAPSTTPAIALDNTPADTNRSHPPGSLPHVTRYSRSQHDGQVNRCEKGTGQSQEDSDPIRRNNVHTNPEIFSGAEKQNVSHCGEKTKACNSESVKLLSAKLGIGIEDFYSSSADEDVCPVCLEEYTPENPKIVLHCSHQYHLGCIYEWMERSACCPVCSRVMIFVETT